MTARLLATLALAAALAAPAPRPSREAAGGERASLAALEQRSKAFYDLLARGERERAAAVWSDLAADLGAFAETLQGRLDRLRDDVVEHDGDLDELYRSPRWREPEVMSLVATYHLAWVHYQGAQLTADAKKKHQLLQQAAEEFSRFLLVNEVPEIYAESLYGRGLAFLDLGETAKAIEDLSAAVDEPRVGARARAALEEARRRAAGRRESGQNDPESQLGQLGELLPRAAAGDGAAEKQAHALARGLAVRGGPWPARVSSLVAEKLGDGKATGVRSSFGLFLLAQLAVDGGRCDDVAALAAASAALRDAGRNRWRPQLLFFDGACNLNAHRTREAAERFALLLAEFPTAPRAREAAYYRLRALDAARTADPSLTGAYEEALATYLSSYPHADGAAEAHFLLGELYRGRGDCSAATPHYAAVDAGAFAARARLGVLECRVAALQSTAPESRAEVLAALRAFVREAPEPAVGARATLLAALVAAGGSPPDHAAVVEVLEGFEKRYPEARDLHPRALELRLAAQVATGHLEAAQQDLDAFLAAPAGAERRRTLSRLGRDLAARAERAAPAARGPALTLARKVYGVLAQDSGDPADRLVLADLDLRAGEAVEARRLYEAVLASDGTSVEALRGAARAAAALGDREAATAYWRRVLEASPAGGTAWYEARLAQVTLLAEQGRKAEACTLLRASRGRATSAGGDQLEARLRQLEPELCP